MELNEIKSIKWVLDMILYSGENKDYFSNIMY